MVELSTALVIEILATVANVLFILLLIREKISCWLFGIASSVLSIYLFLDAQLYSEAFLYLFYALMGCWGWLRWHQRSASDGNPLVKWRLGLHCFLIVTASACALALGFSMQTLTDAQRPFFDAFTTSFSFLATYMEINKVVEGWLYWLVLNVASIWLYQDRSLYIYAALMVFYSIMSVWGLITWRRAYALQPVRH